MLSRHRLCPTTRDNVLNSVDPAMVARLMVGYEFNVTQLIAREICARVIGIKNVILAIPGLLMKIFLAIGVPELPDIDKFIKTKILRIWG